MSPALSPQRVALFRELVEEEPDQGKWVTHEAGGEDFEGYTTPFCSLISAFWPQGREEVSLPDILTATMLRGQSHHELKSLKS